MDWMGDPSGNGVGIVVSVGSWIDDRHCFMECHQDSTARTLPNRCSRAMAETMETGPERVCLTISCSSEKTNRNNSSRY
jgi:hypothetical protein